MRTRTDVCDNVICAFPVILVLECVCADVGRVYSLANTDTDSSGKFPHRTTVCCVLYVVQMLFQTLRSCFGLVCCRSCLAYVGRAFGQNNTQPNALCVFSLTKT